MGPARLEIVAKANDIITQYQAAGYELTLRQLYYQFVARDIIANNQREYKNLGEVLNDARLAGLVDWNAIVDRTRNLRSLGHWGEPSDIIRSAAHSFRIDKWANQKHRIEIWVEKDALVGVIERVANEHDVAYFSCRGYTSQSELWGAAMRLKGYQRAGQKPVILHLGDHDPSGKDMSRDIEDRMDLFAGHEAVEVRRLALNMDQVEQYSPPPNPAKITDSRAAGYIAEFGDESWELDALEPQVIHDLIAKEIVGLQEAGKYEAMEELEEDHRADLEKVSENWDKVVEVINGI